LLATIKMSLERSGYFVHAFSNPSLALKHIREDGCKDCSLIISDLRMEGMTGIEMAYHVKNARSDLRFVLMSAMPISKDEWRDIVPMSENIDDFIPKPFTRKQLVQLVKRWEKET